MNRDEPLFGYLALLGVYGGTFGSLLYLGAKRGVLPRRVVPYDIALLGLATHQLARIVTRDKVIEPLRAPFAEVEGPAGAGEVKSRARGQGLRKAIGTLVTCPYCVGPWVAAVLFTGLVARPRATRLVASVFAAAALSDFAHQAWAFARRASD